MRDSSMRRGDQVPHYFSYLLRMWQTADGEEHVWRASLESPGSGERRGFSSLAALVEYLEQITLGERRSEEPWSPDGEDP